MRVLPFRRRGRRRGRLRARGRRLSGGLRSPAAQLVYAAAVALGGAWLIGLWAVGLLLIVIGAGLAMDAVLRDSGKPEQQPESRHEEILERWRKAK